ncbi:hypothetical protein PV350_04890 [Streptomyces sp. PA03-6a]|nr:hypothetical protein [Streptomyces sp. PA03-6a]
MPNPAPNETRIARHLAAEDWLEDPGDDDWWNSRPEKFRADYIESAREVIAMVLPNGTAPASAAIDLLTRTEHYLSALHGSVARHDQLAANLACAGCELRDQIRQALPALTETSTT